MSAQSPDMTTDRVCLLGFGQTEYEAFVAAGVPVVAWLQPLTPSKALDLPDVETASIDDVQFNRIPALYRPDLPDAVRDRVRAEGMTRFHRSQRRMEHFRPQLAASWVDLENRFQSALHWYYDLLTRHRIDTVVFANVPHEGSLPILYDLSKALGVRTVVCLQSILPDRIWIVEDITDLGAFETTPGGALSPPIPLPEAPEIPFYMANLPKNRTTAARIRYAREAVKFGTKALSLSFLFNARAYEKNKERLRIARMTYQMETLPDEIYGTYDPDRPYVYVPLHLQPEMTTDLLGGAYADQLLMLEELRRALPDDIEIYAKENPKQQSFMREPSFFKRLSAIPGVRYLPPTIPSFALARGARAIATVTGTAGWEGVQIGKPVILFGLGWYMRMPGVFAWAGAQTVADALSWEADRGAAEAAFEALCKRAYGGITDKAYSSLLPDGDTDAALRRGVASIVSVLRNAPSPADPG
ncbi:MAG: hypothetical protein AAFQ51_12560 [Pseudomonadota bacterium]